MNVANMNAEDTRFALMTLRDALIAQLGERFPHKHFQALLNATETRDYNRARTVAALFADKLLAACYRVRELDYRMLDAERHLKEAVSNNPAYERVPLDREDERIVAERFIENYDCNVPENELFARVCTEYLDELVEGGYGA